MVFESPTAYTGMPSDTETSLITAPRGCSQKVSWLWKPSRWFLEPGDVIPPRHQAQPNAEPTQKAKSPLNCRGACASRFRANKAVWTLDPVSPRPFCWLVREGLPKHDGITPAAQESCKKPPAAASPLGLRPSSSFIPSLRLCCCAVHASGAASKNPRAIPNERATPLFYSTAPNTRHEYRFCEKSWLPLLQLEHRAEYRHRTDRDERDRQNVQTNELCRGVCQWRQGEGRCRCHWGAQP
jgi:hypothetical protein